MSASSASSHYYHLATLLGLEEASHYQANMANSAMTTAQQQQQQQQQRPNSTNMDDFAQLSATMLVVSIILSSIILCTLVGNLFVIVAIFVDKNLQTTGNQLVLSLACADLMVACLVMPLGAYNDIRHGWYLGERLCEFWTSADVLCCTASILNLLAIAVDRYWAVTNVDYIYKRTRKRLGLMVVSVWTFGLVVSLAPIFGWKDPDFVRRVDIEHKCLVSQDVAYQIFATISTFYAPLVLLLALYWRIFQVARKRIRCKPGGKLRHGACSQLASERQRQQEQQKYRCSGGISAGPAAISGGGVCGVGGTSVAASSKSTPNGSGHPLVLSSCAPAQPETNGASARRCSPNGTGEASEIEKNNKRRTLGGARAGGNQLLFGGGGGCCGGGGGGGNGGASLAGRPSSGAQVQQRKLASQSHKRQQARSTTVRTAAAATDHDDEDDQAQVTLAQTGKPARETACFEAEKWARNRRQQQEETDEIAAETASKNTLDSAATACGPNRSTQHRLLADATSKQDAASLAAGICAQFGDDGGARQAADANSRAGDNKNNEPTADVESAPSQSLACLGSPGAIHSKGSVEAAKKNAHSTLAYSKETNKKKKKKKKKKEKKRTKSGVGEFGQQQIQRQRIVSMGQQHRRASLCDEPLASLTAQTNSASLANGPPQCQAATLDSDECNEEDDEEEEDDDDDDECPHCRACCCACSSDDNASAGKQQPELGNAKQRFLIPAVADAAGPLRPDKSNQQQPAPMNQWLAAVLSRAGNKDTNNDNSDNATTWRCSSCNVAADEQENFLSGGSSTSSPSESSLSMLAAAATATIEPHASLVQLDAVRLCSLASGHELASRRMQSSDKSLGDSVAPALAAATPIRPQQRAEQFERQQQRHLIQRQTPESSNARSTLSIRRKFKALGQLVSFVQTSRQLNSSSNSCDDDQDQDSGQTAKTVEHAPSSELEIIGPLDRQAAQLGQYGHCQQDDHHDDYRTKQKQQTQSCKLEQPKTSDNANRWQLALDAEGAESSLRPGRQQSATTLQQRTRRDNLDIKREKKAAKTLAIITGVFVCCWLPFFVNALLMPICGLACTPSDLVLSVLLWLGYLNSLLNPIIYTIFSPDFRRAFRRLLCGLWSTSESQQQQQRRRKGAQQQKRQQKQQPLRPTHARL